MITAPVTAGESWQIELIPLSPPPFILDNHSMIDIQLAGEGSDVAITLPSHQVSWKEFIIIYIIDDLMI